MSYYVPCSNCKMLCPATKIAEGTGPHGNKLVCVECDKFIQWLPKNNDLPAHADTTCYHHRCTAWEKEFLLSIAKQRTLSPKQTDIYNRIMDRYSLGEYYGELK